MFEELLIAPDSTGIEEASNIIRAGGLVAFPTETVYGLGANALDEKAVRSIFAAKGRPLTDPLIVHVLNKFEAKNLLDIPTIEEQEAVDLLGDAFWPGPLTLIAKAASIIPMAVTADTGFVGVRVPAHPLASQLLYTCQLPIAAPSANRFAHVSPTRSHHVLDDLGMKGVRVLNGDNIHYESDTCKHGIESTVLRINKEEKSFQIFRQGAVTKEDIEALLSTKASANLQRWKVEVVSRVVNMHTTAHAVSEVVATESGNTAGEIAPGQAVTHYSPDIPCYIVREISDGSEISGSSLPIIDLDAFRSTDEDIKDGYPHFAHQSVVKSLLSNMSSNGIVIIDFGSRLKRFQSSALAYRDLSEAGSSVEGARNLFDYLRWAEGVAGGRVILVARPPVDTEEYADEDKLRLGLADRLFRAASGVEIKFCVV